MVNSTKLHNTGNQNHKNMMDTSFSDFYISTGGYTVRNVARCWANETAVCVGQQISNNIPKNDPYYDHYPDHELNYKSAEIVENYNTKSYLEHVRTTVLETIRKLEGMWIYFWEHFFFKPFKKVTTRPLFLLINGIPKFYHWILLDTATKCIPSGLSSRKNIKQFYKIVKTKIPRSLIY